MDWLTLIFSCGLPVALLALGWTAGRLFEAAHFKSLDEREKDLHRITMSDVKTPPPGVEPSGAILVLGSVVVATDYFKTFVAGLKKLIGGEIYSFERLMERARREAICRMLIEARRRNAVAVINIRVETSSIGAVARNPSPMVEVIAYGTAIMSKNA